MKDDLISRKALIDDLCQDRKEGTFDFTEKQAEAAVKIVRYVNGRIEAQPSVPAVPLEPLCRYLEVYARTPIYNMRHAAEWWKEELEKEKWENWRVEQNASY